MEPIYIYHNNRRLRCGHTTGTCAAAASKAAAHMLLTNETLERVTILTPKGILLELDVEDITMGDTYVSCAVRKDGGDDIDATNGTLVYSTVRMIDSGIAIDGGTGVGRITRKGLDQPVGNAAINRVPRSMIREALIDISDIYGYEGGFDVVISIPEGEEIAKRTFNPRLGIVDGISVLGTSGIVEPMSETALIDTIKVEMRVRKESGDRTILVVPGNYGKDFAEEYPGMDADRAVKCSNFVGEMLDYACELGLDVVLVSNLGKLVKVAGGIMNTHSRNADSRMEILAANSAIAGASIETVKGIMGCISTDDALELIDSEGLIDKVSELLLEKVQFHMNHRTGGRIRTSAVMFSSVYGLLGKTDGADEMLKEIDRDVTV
ncbi:MAG: cobalamin biosynthesis protein CbiD [Thermoplasmata archaeon]|nr:cobalamin biosynthesis protein CbiD [Thermoplasmata archaeon]